MVKIWYHVPSLPVRREMLVCAELPLSGGAAGIAVSAVKLSGGLGFGASHDRIVNITVITQNEFRIECIPAVYLSGRNKLKSVSFSFHSADSRVYQVHPTDGNPVLRRVVQYLPARYGCGVLVYIESG